MVYKKAVEFLVRQVGTIQNPKFVMILDDHLAIDVTDESPVQMAKTAESWLRSPYVGSSRSHPVRNIRPEWHPIVMRVRVPCIPNIDVSGKIRDDVKIVNLFPNKRSK